MPSGPTPLTVQFDSAGSRDPDGSDDHLRLGLRRQRHADSTEPNPSHTYTDAGEYTAPLTVTDADGRTAVSNLDIVAGNTAPEIEVVPRSNGGFFEFGDSVKYEVTGHRRRGRRRSTAHGVIVQPALGHDEHAHPLRPVHRLHGHDPDPRRRGPRRRQHLRHRHSPLHRRRARAGTVPITDRGDRGPAPQAPAGRVLRADRPAGRDRPPVATRASSSRPPATPPAAVRTSASSSPATGSAGTS